MIAGPGMVPVMSQADTGPGQTQAPMWSGQGAGGPGQHPPPTPPQQGNTLPLLSSLPLFVVVFWVSRMSSPKRFFGLMK